VVFLADFADLIRAIKKAATDAVNASNPVMIMFGTVENATPLEVRSDQSVLLKESQLVLARNVTEHTVEMTVEHTTEDEEEHVHAVKDTFTGGGTSQPTDHRHAYRGRKSFVIHNGLIKGEKVIMLRLQGGQRFLIIDRVG